MGPVRIAILVVAAIAAIGLALVVRQMAARKPAPIPVAVATAPPQSTVQVLTARRDLPVGTRLASGDVAWTPWPATALNAAYITDGAAPARAPIGAARIGETAASTARIVFAGGGSAMQAAMGAIVREPILANEPIVERKIVRGGQGGYMSVVLQPGMRAMSIPVNVETGAGGFILPGDRVDVLMSRKLDAAAGGGSGQTAVADVVMRNLRVLAVDQQVDLPKNGKSILGATITLEVPAGNAPDLLKAKAQGDLALSLRSYADMGGPSGASDGMRAQAVRMVRAGHSSEVLTQ